MSEVCCHPERVEDHGRGLPGVDRPADHEARERVTHLAAIHLALVGGYSVISVSHNSLGRSRANTRRTKSSEVTCASLEPFGSRFETTRIPSSRMIDSTALSLAAMERPKRAPR